MYQKDPPSPQPAAGSHLLTPRSRESDVLARRHPRGGSCPPRPSLSRHGLKQRRATPLQTRERVPRAQCKNKNPIFQLLGTFMRRGTHRHHGGQPRSGIGISWGGTAVRAGTSWGTGMAPGRGYHKQGHRSARRATFLHPPFLGGGSQPRRLAGFYKCCLCPMLMKASQLPPAPPASLFWLPDHAVKN